MGRGGASDKAVNGSAAARPLPLISLLGRIQIDGSEPGSALPAKGRAILAYLAFHSGEAISRDRLADLLWERSGQEQARQSLRQALSVLRRQLPAAAAAGLSASVEEARLAAVTDVQRFESLAASTEAWDWDAALALWRGPFLDDLALDAPAFEEWAQRERRRLDEIRADLLARLAERRLAGNDAAAAIGAARDLVAQDPLREDGHRLLIRAYVAAGRRAEAIAQYEQMALILRTELSVAPDPQTTALVEGLKATARSEPAAQKPRPNGAEASVSATPLPTLAESSAPAVTSWPPWWWPGLLAVGAALVVLLGGVAYRYWPQENAASAPLLVVQPFEVATPGPEAAALARALSTRMTGGLSNVPTVRVRSADAPGPVPEFRVEGKVEMIEGGGALVTARLVSNTGVVLRNSEFRAPHRPSTEMQDEILGRVGRNITEQLNEIAYPRRSGSAAIEKAREVATAAVNRVNRGDTSDAVLALFREAMSIDPESAAIKAYFGNALVAQALNSGVDRMRQRDYLDEAMRVFAEVDAVNPHHQISVYGRCQGLRALMDLQAARAACERARAVMPWSARVYKELGYVMLYLGVLDQAQGYFEAAERLERQGTIRWTWAIGAGVTALLKGQDQEAAHWLDIATSLRPNFAWYPLLAAVAADRRGDLGTKSRMLAAFRSVQTTGSLDAYLESFFPSSIAYAADFKGRMERLKQDMATLLAEANRPSGPHGPPLPPPPSPPQRIQFILGRIVSMKLSRTAAVSGKSFVAFWTSLMFSRASQMDWMHLITTCSFVEK